MFLVALVAVILVAVVLRLTLPPYRRRRMAAELREDWWPRFEREFRAYASGSWASARDAERGR
jgi:hypothetical protein